MVENNLPVRIKLLPLTGFPQCIDTTINNTPEGDLALVVDETSDSRYFIDVASGKHTPLLPQRVYKTINVIRKTSSLSDNEDIGQRLVLSIDNCVDVLDISTGEVVNTLPEPVSGNININAYGQLMKTHEGNGFIDYVTGRKFDFKVRFGPVLNNIGGYLWAQDANRKNTFVDFWTEQTVMKFPHAVSHKTFPVMINGRRYFVVKSKDDNMTFFDVEEGRPIFRFLETVSSVINHHKGKYLIQTADKFFYEARFETR